MKTQRIFRMVDLAIEARNWAGWRWTPRAADPAAASTALALSIALLRALRDRGVLSQVELDDVLSEAAERFPPGKVEHLVDAVRADLERKDD